MPNLITLNRTFRNGKSVQLISLFYPAAIVSDRFFLILQIEPKHHFATVEYSCARSSGSG
jgi:hypothetical protein